MIELINLILSLTLFKFTAICAIGLYICYRYILSKCNYWESQGVKTASVSLYTRITTANEVWEQDLVRKYGKIFGIYELTNPILFLSEPDLIRDVLVKDFHIFPNRRVVFSTGADPILDSVLIIIKEERWKKIRPIMSPVFTTGKLRKMLPLIEECLQTLVKYLDDVNGKEADSKTIFAAYSMEAVIQIAFGTKVNALIDKTHPIIMNSRKIFNKDMTLKIYFAILLPKLAKLLKISIFDPNITKFFKQFTLNILKQRKNTTNSAKREDFLQIMLDAIGSEDSGSENVNNDQNNSKLDENNNIMKNTLTNDEFVGQCATFILGGSDSTASALSFAIYNLALNPEIQEKLFEEVKPILDSNIILYLKSLEL